MNQSPEKEKDLFGTQKSVQSAGPGRRGFYFSTFESRAEALAARSDILHRGTKNVAIHGGTSAG
jgi:hypothetical protein